MTHDFAVSSAQHDELVAMILCAAFGRMLFPRQVPNWSMPYDPASGERVEVAP